MSRQTSPVRQRDITRYLKAAMGAGVAVARVEIGPDGTVVLISKEEAPTPAGDFDAWKRKRDARAP